MPSWLVLLLMLAPVGPGPAPAPRPLTPPPAVERPAPERVIRYTVAFHGARPSGFRRAVREALDDPRGWSLGGRVRFREVRRGAGFRLHLAAPAALPALGCWDVNWSCRSGDDVVINARRWAHGSPFWRGRLRDYRRMLIGHEVGHWLGFGHATCAGRGEPAPLMMQQSMGTAGCRPNPWPRAAERRELRRSVRR